ncbi:MAG: hypothetical protein AB7O65_02180 [Candidatus Korobacteraceae bacterium]
MKTFCLVIASVLLLAALVVSPAAAQTPSGQAPTPAPKEHSMAGCLEKGAEPNTFRLTKLEKGPQLVEIAETTAKLDPHVSHKVEITGTAVPGKEVHTMKVTAVKHISPTCP